MMRKTTPTKTKYRDLFPSNDALKTMPVTTWYSEPLILTHDFHYH
jgi:hypothetical protein